jgi:hypothetical protein
MPTLQATLFKGGLRAVILFIVISLGGCATAPQTAQLLDHTSGLPKHYEISKVGFFPQKKYQCGPAALATVFQFAGVDVLPEDLVPEIYLPARQGSLQIEILAASRRHDLVAYHIEPYMEDLLKEVAAGNPVLVLQNLGLSWLPSWHYAVVVGFNLTTKTLVLRSGVEKSHYWGIVVLSPDVLPETAQPQRYIKTIIGLESIKHWHAAQTAYKTALHRWPNNLIALIGLGNSSYQLKDLATAEQAFRTAIHYHPDSAPANNNLAQILLEEGKFSEAKTYALHAITIGGPQLTTFQATLREINQQITK